MDLDLCLFKNDILLDNCMTTDLHYSIEQTFGALICSKDIKKPFNLFERFLYLNE